MKKRLISFLLAVVLTASVAVLPVQAATNSWEKTDSLAQNMINAALAQKGKKNADFNKEDGMPKDAWCAYFIIWLGRVTGGSNAGIFPKKYSGYGTTGKLAEYILDKNKGKITCFHDETYNYIVERTNKANVSKTKISSFTPQPGDLIFFRSSGRFAHHVGLVYKVTSSLVYYVDGNGSYDTAEYSYSSTYVDTHSEKRNHYQIAAYLRPDYGSGTVEVPTTTVTNCRYRVTVPANYKLQCYQYPESTTKYRSIAAQSSSYTITCTQKLELSTGGTRYFFTSGDGYELYFDYVSSMSVETLHNYSSTYSEATCTAEGYTKKTCTCGYSTTNTISALGHDWQTWLIMNSPACTKDGSELTVCSRCNASGSRTIPATGHSWAKATCTAPKTCTTCGDAEGAALGHSYTNGSCIRCGKAERVLLMGDADGDGKVNNVDAMLVLQYAVGLKEAGTLNLDVCDVSGDGKVNNVDAMKILQYAVGLISKF